MDGVWLEVRVCVKPHDGVAVGVPVFVLLGVPLGVTVLLAEPVLDGLNPGCRLLVPEGVRDAVLLRVGVLLGVGRT